MPKPVPVYSSRGERVNADFSRIERAALADRGCYDPATIRTEWFDRAAFDRKYRRPSPPQPIIPQDARPPYRVAIVASNGQRFESIEAAARAFECSAMTITRHAKSGRPVLGNITVKRDLTEGDDHE